MDLAENTLVLKLNHDLPEIRKRASESLHSKLVHGIVSTEKLSNSTDVCREVLRLLDQPFLLTQSSLVLLEHFISCRESFVQLYVLGLEEKVRSAGDTLDEESEVCKRLRGILATVLSNSRGVNESSSSRVDALENNGARLQFVPRMPASNRSSVVSITLDKAGFKGLPNLQRVKLDKETEQKLFEISFRLEHSEDELTLLTSLQELSHYVCRDYPYQAVLQQETLFHNVLRLLHLKTDEQLLGAALSFLGRFFKGLKQDAQLTQNKDILTQEEVDGVLEENKAIESSYPQPIFIPGRSGESSGASSVAIAPYVHMAVLHLLTLLGEPKLHYLVTEPILSALDLLYFLGQICGQEKECFSKCISMYLIEVEKVFQKHSSSWKALDQEGSKGSKAFQADMFDINLVRIVVEVLGLRPNCEVKRLMPRSLQAYLCKVFNNECVGMCLPDMGAKLLPFVEQIDRTLAVKKAKSKEVLKNFLSLSKDLKALRLAKNSSQEDNMKTINIILDILPTVIGMGDTPYFDHIFKLILHLLMRSNWTFLEGESVKEEFYVALQNAMLTILSKACLEARVKAYKIWLEAIMDCGESELKVVLGPLSNGAIMSCLVVYGLQEEKTKEDVAQILLCACKESSCRMHVKNWHLWLECYNLDKLVGPVISSMNIMLNRDVLSKDGIGMSWGDMRKVYCNSFSCDKKDRKIALDHIYAALQKKGCAEDLKNFNYLLSSSACQKVASLDPLDLPCDGEEKGIQTLMSIFTNSKIEVSIQKSSAMQLLLALKRSCKHQEVSEEMLGMCSSIMQKCTTSDSLEYDEEFLIAILELLDYSIRENEDSLPWFTKQSEDFFIVLSSLFFHPSIQVQQTVATIVFSVIFGEERLRLVSSGLCLNAEEGNKHFPVAKAFESCIIPPLPCAFTEVSFEDGNFALVEEIATKVRDTINTRNAIKALVLSGDTSPPDLPKEICEMVQALHPQFVLEAKLSQMKDAKTHEEFEHLMLLLLNYSCCDLGALKQLSAMNWFKAFQRFLNSRPASKKDWRLWDHVFTMTSKMLDNCTVSHPLLMNLVLLYDEAIFPTMMVEEYWNPLCRMRTGIKAKLHSSQASPLRKKYGIAQTIYSGLETLVSLLKAVRASGSIAVQKYTVDTLASEETISMLANFVVSDDWDYGLRTITMESLVELLICFLDLKALGVYQYTPSDEDSVFNIPITKIIKSVCITGTNQANGKGLVKHALEYLKQVTNLKKESWTTIWAETDCTFWISKLLRDPESLVRKTSLQILCALSNPTNPSLIAMLDRCWPDRLYTIVQIAFEERECDLVRAKAMKIISLALAAERSASDPQYASISESYPTDSSIRKNVYQTMEEHKFWDLLKNSLLWNRSQLMGGFLSIVAEMLLSDSEYVFQNCRVDQICKVTAAIFNSCSKQLDQGLKTGESYFETVIPLSMALNILQIVFQKEKYFLKVLSWIPSMNLCKAYSSFSGKLSSLLKKELPLRISYYSACLPLLMQFTAVISNLMHTVFNSKSSIMTEEEIQNSIAHVANGICSLYRCQILPQELKLLCCKLLEITLQNEHYARKAMDGSEDPKDGSDTSGAVLCNHMIADLRSMTKHMKLGISARRQSILQASSSLNAATLALRALLTCSVSAKSSLIRTKYYADLMMEFRVHSNAILAASLHKKENPAIIAKSEHKLMHIFVLLKHFTFKSRVSSDVLTQEGAVELIRAQFAQYPKGNAQVQNGALGLLVNLAANSSIACLEILDVKVQSKDRSPSFFLDLLGMWQSRRTLAPITRLCGYVIQALLQVSESRTAILKTDFVSKMISFLERLLKKKDSEKIRQTLKFLSDLAAFKDSRSFLLHHPSFSDLMDFILSVRTLENNGKTMEEVLLFIRNMSFSQDMKTYLSCRHEVLHLLVGAAQKFSASPKMASIASSALWALLYKSQKMKACIRNISKMNERLIRTEAEVALYSRGLESEGLGSTEVNYINKTQDNLHQISAILLGQQDHKEPLAGPTSPVSILSGST